MATPEDKSKSKSFPTLIEWKAEMDEAWRKHGREISARSTSMFGPVPYFEGNPTLGDIIAYGTEKGIWKATNAVIAGFEKGAEKFRNLRARITSRPQRPQ